MLRKHPRELPGSPERRTMTARTLRGREEEENEDEEEEGTQRSELS